MNLTHLRDLTFALVIKEIKSKYKSATLGFLWIFINPLLQMIALTIVFSYFLKFSVSNYPLFVLSGLLPWTYFSLALSAGTSSLVSNRDLIKKVPFNRELLPISAVLANLLTFLAALLLLLLFNLNPALFLLIPIIFIQTLLIIGITLLTSSLDIYYRDVSFIVQAGLMVWFYLTPVFYPVSMVPVNFRFIYDLNPMVGIITGFQSTLRGSPLEIGSLMISAAEAIIFFVIGFIFFRRRAKYFADWI